MSVAEQGEGNERRKDLRSTRGAGSLAEKHERDEVSFDAEHAEVKTEAPRTPPRARRRVPSNPRVVRGALVKPAARGTDASSANATSDVAAEARGPSTNAGRLGPARATRRSPAGRTLDTRGKSGAQDRTGGRTLDDVRASTPSTPRRAKAKRQPTPLPRIPSAGDHARGATTGTTQSDENGRCALPPLSDEESLQPTPTTSLSSDERDPAITEALALLLDCYRVGDVLQIARLVAKIIAELDALERTGAATEVDVADAPQDSEGAADPTTDGAAVGAAR
jgi:hypothetical protein